MDEGRTRWGRTALVALPGLGLVAAMTAAMANSLLAASFAVAGVPIQLKSDDVSGSGFAGVVSARAGQGVTYAGFTTAELSGLCAATTPEVLGVPFTLKITAGDADPKTREISASGLLLDAKQLSGNAEFDQLKLGVAKGSLDRGPAEVRGETGTSDFGLQAERARIGSLDADALSAAIGGTFKLDNLQLSVSPGATRC
ncbi:DUF6230 family protein [Saccharothrix sp. NPDC042600]|uniref:DUF6230 family protein n=1 Tax=Saccharothrix TaxID=2071 RepID=UPI0034012865|nr:hypothetical protein GCM10017745_34520 [Saccharothrix mutabilis subsp. capreolus]